MSVAKGTILALMALLTSGCAGSIEKTHKIATDYNRAFADSRNEALLLNVLRAWRREPLQFSTMGTVTGSVRSTVGGEVGVEGLFVGVADNLKPKVTFGGGPNPSVTVIPLTNKEFAQGILRPVDLDTIDFMLSQHWDRELVLPLVIGGVECKDSVVINRGNNSELNWDYALQASIAKDFSLKPGDSEEVVLRLTPTEATELLKNGVGEGRSITKLMSYDDWKAAWKKEGREIPAGSEAYADRVFAVIERKRAKSVVGLPLRSHCDVATQVDEPKALLRSVDSMIYFLAEIHRQNIQREQARCQFGSRKEPETQDSATEAQQAAFRRILTAGEARLAAADRSVREAADDVSAADQAVSTASRSSRRRPAAAGQLMKAEATRAQAADRLKRAEESQSAAAKDLRAISEWAQGSAAKAARAGGKVVDPRDLFRVRVACGGQLPRSGVAASTRFHGATYYILDKERAGDADRTLEVMAFLSDLLALQTSESIIKGNAPLVTVAQ